MRQTLGILSFAIAVVVACQAHANPIYYEVQHLSGDRWEYHYTVDNQTDAPIEELTVWFDLGLYENLDPTGNPTPDWDGWAAQPDPQLPDDGFVDWLTFGAPIAIGERLGGFSVAFDWLGSGLPGTQFFEIIDPETWRTLSSGMTQPLIDDPVTPVPEPGTVALLGAGLTFLVLLRRRPANGRKGCGARVAGAATLALAVTAPQTGLAAVDDLSVVDRQLVATQRAGRVDFDYSYTITVHNPGAPLSGVTASVASLSPDTRIIDGDVSLGDLGSGATTSTDTFTLRQNRRALFDPADLVWTFTASAPQPNAPPDIESTPVTQVSIGVDYVYLVQATDPDPGDVLTYTLRAAPPGMSIDSATGRISWAPQSTGPADVDLEVTDSAGLSARQIFLVRVDGGDDDQPPVLEPLPQQTTIVGTTMMAMAAGSDPEGEPLRYGLDSAPAGMAIHTGTGEVLWTPAAGQTGLAEANVTATDPGGQSAQTSFTVLVLPERENGPPSLNPLGDITVTAPAPVAVHPNATDPDEGDILTFSASGLPAGGRFDPATGSLRWLAGSTDVGTRSVTITVTDSAGAADSRTFDLTVVEPAAAPVAVDDAYTLGRNQTLQVAAPGVLANDSDPNHDLLSVHHTSEPALGTLDQFPGDGSFTYSPPPVPPMEIGLDLQCEVAAMAALSPAAADIDGDGDIELVAVSMDGNGTEIITVDGASCEVEIVQVRPDLGQTHSWNTVTLVDLDDDPDLEIVTPYLRWSEWLEGVHRTRLLALNRDGSPVWEAPGGLSEAVSFTTANVSGNETKGPIPVDLNGDGEPELIYAWNNVAGSGMQNVTLSAVVAFDGRTGSVLWEYIGPPQRHSGSSPPRMPVIADLDLDGRVEIVWHTSVLDHEGNLKFLLPAESSIGSGLGSSHLTVAPANFDDDPYAELIAYDDRNHYLYEHTGAVKWQRPRESCDRVPYTGITVAEFDGTAGPEYALLYCADDVPSPRHALAVFDADGSLLWTHYDRNWIVGKFLKIRATAPVAFDFDQDGIDELVEVLPGGEGELRDGLYIFDGSTGDIVASADMEVSNITAGPTLTIADVDLDGAAEIVAVSDTSRDFNDTVQIWQGLPGHPFPPAPSIRNHATYQPWQVEEDGSIPAHQQPHWLIPGLNKYYAVAVIPGEHESTTDAFTYVAGDGSAESDEATVTVTLADVNAPTIISRPPLGASPGFEYRYGALATDADFGDQLSWSLVDAPAGMAVDTFGIVTWLPDQGDLGTHRVQLVVTDEEGHTGAQEFRLTVVPPVTVPDLLGTDAGTAGDVLTGAGLAVGSVTESFSFTVPVGEVISQSIAGGAASGAGALIDYVVSLGPPPIVVPDLVELTPAVATAVLEDLTLQTGAVTYVNDDDTARGLVLAQSIDPRTEVTSGTAVDLTVSGGPALAVQLQRSLVGAGESVDYSLTTFDSSGAPQPLPDDLTVQIEADAGASGPGPVADSGAILTAEDTRGGYQLRVQSASLGVDRQVELVVSPVLRHDGVQAAYAVFAEQMSTLADLYDALGEALQSNDVLTVQALAAELAALRDAIDLDDLALTPAAALETGFLPDTPGKIPDLAEEAFFNQVGATMGALQESRLFLERLDAAAGRNDDVRMRFLNQRLEHGLAALEEIPLTRWATMANRSALHQLLSVEAPRLIAADLDTLMAALGDAGLLANRHSIQALYASTAPVTGTADFERPTFFTLGGMVSASAFRTKVVDEFYVPMLKQVLRNTQNLIAEGLIEHFLDPAEIPGIVTGASLSFHGFELGNSVVEAFVHSVYPGGVRAQLIGPTLVADLAEAIDGVRNVRFNSMKGVRKAVGDLSDAASSAVQTFEDGYKQLPPSQILTGCVFDNAPDCQQLGFANGLPTVHQSGSFPAPVLVVVYDAASGNVSVGNFLFYPKPE